MTLECSRPAGLRASSHLSVMLAVVLLAVLAACVPRPPTGLAEGEPREGGLTGTGRTAVLGIVSDIGSITVNGLRIAVDPELVISTAFGSETAANLRPGHVVAVTAINDRDGWQALTIERAQVLIGPIDSIEPEAGKLIVNGVPVRLAIDSIPVADDMAGTRPLALERLDPGTWVEVSGLWRRDGLEASRIERVPARDFVQIRGTLQASVRNGEPPFRIGPLLVVGLDPSVVAIEDVVAVRGDLEHRDGRVMLRAREVARLPLPDRIEHYLVDGFTNLPDAQGRYTLLGSGIRALAEPATMRDDVRRLYCARDPGPGEQRLKLTALADLPNEASIRAQDRETIARALDAREELCP